MPPKKAPTSPQKAAPKSAAPKSAAPKSAAPKAPPPARPAAAGATVSYGSGTPDDPWQLKTPPLSSEFQAWRDEAADPPALVVQVGTTRLSYRLRAIDDLAAMLEARGDWVLLGNADEGKPTAEGTIEAWARAADNPVGGYYGLRKGYRGRFANYVTPVLEVLGLAELEHGPRNNRARRAGGAR